VSASVIVLLALNLRRALVDHPYRARAFWTAVGGLTLLALIGESIITDLTGSSPTTSYAVWLGGAAVWGLIFFGLYGWIWSNVAVAVEADFFNRDVLWWKRGGVYIAPALVVVSYAFFNLPPWWTIPQSGPLLDVFNGLFYGAVVYATVALAISYWRIKDMRIKTYTKWVVLSIAALFAIIFLAPDPLALLAGFAWFFCMYKSVSSLAIKTRRLESDSGSSP